MIFWPGLKNTCFVLFLIAFLCHTAPQNSPRLQLLFFLFIRIRVLPTLDYLLCCLFFFLLRSHISPLHFLLCCGSLSLCVCAISMLTTFVPSMQIFFCNYILLFQLLLYKTDRHMIYNEIHTKHSTYLYALSLISSFFACSILVMITPLEVSQNKILPSFLASPFL